MDKAKRNAYCSYCRKSYRDVGPLVEGPDEVYICGACIELCQTILDQERRRRSPHPPEQTPVDVKAALDRLIAGQEEAKEAVARAATGRNDQPSDRWRAVLLIGPTRSSRILLAKALSHVLGVPFAEGDPHASTGTVEVDPLLFALLQASGFDAAAAGRGVLFVDGLDRREVRQALRDLWPGDVAEDIRRRLQVDVARILLVFGGEFPELDPSRRVATSDLLGLGIAPGLVDHIGDLAPVDPLDEATLERVVRALDFDRLASDEPGDSLRGLNP